jgi:hypothetical protein
MAHFQGSCLSKLKKGDEFLFEHSDHSCQTVYTFESRCFMSGQTRYWISRNLFYFQGPNKKKLIKGQRKGFVWKIITQ